MLQCFFGWFGVYLWLMKIRKAGKSRKAKKQRGSTEEKQRSKEAERQHSGEAEKQRSKEAKKQKSGEAEKQRTIKAETQRKAERQKSRKAEKQKKTRKAKKQGNRNSLKKKREKKVQKKIALPRNMKHSQSQFWSLRFNLFGLGALSMRISVLQHPSPIIHYTLPLTLPPNQYTPCWQAKYPACFAVSSCHSLTSASCSFQEKKQPTNVQWNLSPSWRKITTNIHRPFADRSWDLSCPSHVAESPQPIAEGFPAGRSLVPA